VNRLAGGGIELKPGVAFCFRRFHELIEDMTRGAWVRFVRRVRANRAVLGEAKDLDEFLFGSERVDLSGYAPILRKVQEDRCFYCDGKLADAADVDHFIPWARYPVDLGHNFVLSHQRCNNAKRDQLAATDHLERWCRRNEEHGTGLAADFDEHVLPNDVAASQRITRWAYAQAEATATPVWIAKGRYETLDQRWRALPGMA
jgi:hypothetical protein